MTDETFGSPRSFFVTCRGCGMEIPIADLMEGKFWTLGLELEVVCPTCGRRSLYKGHEMFRR